MTDSFPCRDKLRDLGPSSSMPLCGTRLASFGIVLSLWGAVQLSLTGLALSGRSVAFIDDIAPSAEYADSDKVRRRTLGNSQARSSI